MSDDTRFNTKELEVALTKLQSAVDGPAYNGILLKAGRVTGAKTEELMGEYPAPQQTTKFRNRKYTWKGKSGKTITSKFKSLKQQIKVMILLKEGKWPYRRTGNLGRAATSKAEVISDGVKITAGFNQGLAPYAEHVVGLPEEQALVHQDVWAPLATTIQDNVLVLGNVFTGVVQSEYDAIAGSI